MLDIERIRIDLKQSKSGVLHRRLRSALQSQILDGTIQPGEPLPAERALQESLGVSRSTVRLAIQGLAESGLVRSLVGAGTFVQSSPVGTPNRDLVGILLPDVNFHVYYAELASTLGYLLREAGYHVDLTIHNERTESMEAAIDRLIANNAAAVIITASAQSKSAEASIRRLHAKGIYVMLLTRYVESDFSLDYVGADNERIGYQATQNLIQLGHRTVVHIAARGTSTALDRARGYLRAMGEAQLRPLLFSPPHEQGLLAAELVPLTFNGDANDLLRLIKSDGITAAFTFNDYLAVWLQRELRGHGLVVPKDLSIVSVDNLPVASLIETPLSSFALPGAEIGATAASILLRRLQGDVFPPQKILLPGRFVHRQSTAPHQEKQTVM